jgi:hypothetical protein
MIKKLLFLIPTLALFGQGCQMPLASDRVVPPTPVASEGPTFEPEPDDEMCSIQTPQVYYYAKTLFTVAEIRQIERDIVTPIKNHYSDDVYGHVVAITIKKGSADLVVEMVIDQAQTEDAGYEGVVLNRLPSGAYEAWTPTDPGPGYEG